jgi:MFS family permease
VGWQGGLVFGYDIGGSGGSFVMTGFRAHFGWPLPIPPGGAEPGWVLKQMALINALLPLGGLLGAAPSGAIADTVGRRPTIAISAAIFTAAAIIQAPPVLTPTPTSSYNPHHCCLNN